MYEVYVKTDENNRIVAVNSSFFLLSFEGWVKIDEGEGEKYAHAQGNYFDALYTEDFIPRYKWDGEQAVLRTESEIEADRAEIPVPEPSEDESNVWDELDKAYQEGVDSV